MAHLFWRSKDSYGALKGALRPQNCLDTRGYLLARGIYLLSLYEIPTYLLMSPVALRDLVALLFQMERIQRSGYEVYEALQLLITEIQNLKWLMLCAQCERISSRECH